MDFSNITFEVIDITTNSKPEIFINKGGITITRRVLSDLNFPANVQYGIDAEHRVFVIKACKSNEAKASPFSKPAKDQKNTLTINNKNLKESVVALISDYDIEKRYGVVGFFDAENKIMYFDMATAEEAVYRADD